MQQKTRESSKTELKLDNGQRKITSKEKSPLLIKATNGNQVLPITAFDIYRKSKFVIYQSILMLKSLSTGNLIFNSKIL